MVRVKCWFCRIWSCYVSFECFHWHNKTNENLRHQKNICGKSNRKFKPKNFKFINRSWNEFEETFFFGLKWPKRSELTFKIFYVFLVSCRFRSGYFCHLFVRMLMHDKMFEPPTNNAFIRLQTMDSVVVSRFARTFIKPGSSSILGHFPWKLKLELKKQRGSLSFGLEKSSKLLKN